MSSDYFHRVHRLTPTMFWINNPTRKEADKAIEAGALGCTNNPSYTWKMLKSEEDGDYARKFLHGVIQESDNDGEVVSLLQSRLVAPVAEKFMPLWKKSNGEHGYVSIQGDPVNEEDPDVIIAEARRNRKISPNICIKIPTTQAGLEAMEVLLAENTPINATEIMAISQGISLCETYKRITDKTGIKPKIFLSYIAGIYEEYLSKYADKNGIRIERDILGQSGNAGARKMYRIMQEKGYTATIIGGGARDLKHFTEMVGGPVVVTINWENSADMLLDQNPDVVFRFFNPVPDSVIDELSENLVDFRRGYASDGLSIEEYEKFGPVEYFREMFLGAWNNVVSLVAGERKKL